MSLILEALKKSEANRRLGQAPDLGTPFTPARRGRNPLWALTVIILCLGTGLWWWFGRSPPAPVPATPEPALAAAPAPVRATAPTQNHDATQQQDQRIFNAARRREANAQTSAAPNKDEQIWVAAQRHDAPGQLETGRMAKRFARKGPAHPPVAATPPMTTAAPPPQRHPEVAPPPQPQPHPDAAPPPQPHPEAAAPPQRHPETTAPPPPGTPKLDVPAYYDLPFATRKALPQLSLSMHVYAADPKQRFVILDGTRMVEGDTTTDSVTLREIRPDGVVLEFQGQRFFFPRDGM
jgi:general secretion pathway protein B